MYVQKKFGKTCLLYFGTLRLLSIYYIVFWGRYSVTAYPYVYKKVYMERKVVCVKAKTLRAKPTFFRGGTKLTRPLSPRQ